MGKSNINIGISEKDRKKIVAGLARMQADTYTLYLKTHNFHWNVTGPHRHQLTQKLQLPHQAQRTVIWRMKWDIAAWICKLWCATCVTVSGSA